MRLLRGGVIALAGIFAVAPPGVPGAVAGPPAYEYRAQCEVLGVSPDFERDLTMFCAANEYLPESVTPSGVVRVGKSTDGGKSWEEVPAVGLQGLGVSYPTQLVLSPFYGENSTLYVQMTFGTSQGLYRSTDDGGTFINVDPLAGSGNTMRSLSPFTDASSAATDPITAGDRLAYAAPETDPAFITPPLFHVPVAGAPDRIIRFLLPEKYPAVPGFGLATGSSRSSPDPQTWKVQTYLYGCEAALACTTKLFDFPPGWDLLDGEILSNGAIYVVLSERDEPDDLTVWLSGDRGESFERWSSVEAYLARVPADRITSPRVSVAVSPSDSETYFLRVSYENGSTKRAPPTELILRSKDGGRSWKKRSFGNHFNHPSPQGAVPWNNRAGPRHAQGDLVVLPGRLLVIARETDRRTGNDYTGVYCSTNEGLSWHRSCNATP